LGTNVPNDITPQNNNEIPEKQTYQAVTGQSIENAHPVLAERRGFF
jgi:hypothetical protein